MKIHKKLVALAIIWAFLLFFGNAEAASLSQSNVSLSPGQSMIVTAYNVSSSLYLSSNSNNSIATVSINGNNINIYALASGITTATICEYSIGGCNSIYITVSGNGNNYNSYGTLTFSQTNPTLSMGQTSIVTVYDSSSTYNSYPYGTSLYISNNSNQSVATATVVSNSISIYANNIGSSTITVCKNGNINYCGTIYVSVVGGYLATNNIAPGLSISSLILPVGGAATIASGNSTGLSVSNNSNPSVASTSYSSSVAGCTATSLFSVLTGQPCSNSYSGGGYSSVLGCVPGALYSSITGQSCFNNQINNYANNSVQILAAAIGSDTITICQNNNICSAIYITVY